MIEKTILDMLTADSVSIKKQQYTKVNEVEYPIGEPWRRAYTNSVQGRERVYTEVEEPYKTIIMIMWGNTPSVTDTTV